MSFLKQFLLLVVAVVVLGLVALFHLLNQLPDFKPCDPYETVFSNDTIKFPIDAGEAKLKFGGMEYDSLPPYSLYTTRGDTLIRLLFRPGYSDDRFLPTVGKHAAKNRCSQEKKEYDVKGIYNYSFVFSSGSYKPTFDRFVQIYGTPYREKISKNHNNSFTHWKIGPCHHLLLFNKKPFSDYHNVKKSSTYVYVMFAYNVTDKEIEDMVEIEGGIRNDIF